MPEQAASWNPALRPGNVVKPSPPEAPGSFNESSTDHDPERDQQLIRPILAESVDGHDKLLDSKVSDSTFPESTAHDASDQSDFQQSWLLESESTDPFSQIDKLSSMQKENSGHQNSNGNVEKAMSDNLDQLHVSTFSSTAQSDVSQSSNSQAPNNTEETKPQSVDPSFASSGEGAATENELNPFATSQDTWELEETSKSYVGNNISQNSLLGTDDEWGLSEHGFDLGSSINKEPTTLHSSSTGPDITSSTKETKSSEMETPMNDDLAEMWKAALGDEEFLEEQNYTSTDDSAANYGVSSEASERWPGSRTDETMQASQTFNQNLYGTPSSSQNINTTQWSSASQNASVASQQQAKQIPSLISRAESYSDKSKGGYHSPYDLPMSLTKSRKRPSINPSLTTTGANHGRSGHVAPPPRSSSISEYNPQMTLPSEALSPSASASGPPSQGLPVNGHLPAHQPGQPIPTNTARKTSADFFADLPSGPKPRQSSAGGRYAPQGPVRTPTAPPTSSQLSQNLLSEPDFRSRPSNPPMNRQMTDDRLSSPSDLPALASRQTSPSIPQVSKYSPAPIHVPSQTSRYNQMPQAPPARANRYSPAPSGPVASSRDNVGPGYQIPPQAIQAAQHFAPRTSSPLTHGSVLPDQPPDERPELSKQLPNVSRDPVNKVSLPSTGEDLPAQPQNLGNTTNNTAEAILPDRPERSDTQTPPKVPLSVTNSPKRSYVPEKAARTQQMSTDLVASPPRGDQNQIYKRSMTEPYQIEATEPSAASLNISGPQASTTVRVSSHQRRRTITQGLEFVRPNDSRANDPLERWRGCPIFHWGLGGSVLLHFPQQVPRYGTGHAIPMIQCTPGEVALHNIKNLNPLPNSVASFPGPLKGKSKKKEVSTWLDATIKSMAAELEALNLDNLLPSDVRQRSEEKILLWKVMQILVKQNGKLEGSPEINEAVARCLAISESTDSMTGSVQDDSRYAAYHNDHASPQAIQEIRRNLLQGEREKAVWYAADQGLWAHAMLISSTLSKDVWKQVIQEFARQDVKKAGESAESVAALYQVFAGNWEESIDELVPPSERAGFQMVRKDTTAPTRSALQGLERWRETVRLIMNNRSNEDHRALNALGKLLASYGRPEAAHICHLFAGSLSKFGGADDPQADVVLLGAEHLNQKLDLDLNLDAILLTEVYEFALTLASSSASSLPHLQMFKLHHGMVLAENGYRNEAQQYCDAISAAIKATSRPSPYYHPNLVTQLDDLSKRLSKSPKDSSASWIPKPSMEKVSGSMWAKFNNFVAGDDSGKEPSNSTFPAPENVGPFASFSRNSPEVPLQPASSIHPLYTSSSQQALNFAPPSTSRYTPVPSQPYYSSPSVPVNSLEPQKSISPSNQLCQPGTQPLIGSPYASEPQPSQEVTSPYPFSSTLPQLHSAPSVPQPSAYGANNSETVPMSVDVTEQTPFQTTLRLNDGRQSYFPDSLKTNPSDVQMNGSNASTNKERHDSQTASSTGYVPPTSSYEPPAYQPYMPEQDSREKSQADKSTAKSSGVDDDDDELMRRAAALTKQQKSQADKEADDAFRKAAEADGRFYMTSRSITIINENLAARAQQAGGDKKGWFGSWFKRGASEGPPGQGPIKAKLGEENSFYYDPNLKKWINKKAGADATSVAAPSPPPPRGPPSRSSSAAPRPGGRIPMGPQPPMPSSTPPLPKMSSMAQLGTSSRSATPVRAESPASGAAAPRAAAATDVNASNTAAPAPAPELAPPAISAQASASAPPSRPGTAMSTASSIDDLIGAPGARKGGTLKKGKKGRGYVDVMAK